MADVNIDAFSDHDKTDSHPDETGENIPLNPGGSMGEGFTWEPEREQETSFEEKEKLKKEGSLILMLTVCTRSYPNIMAEPQMQPITTTLNAKASGFTFKGRDEPLANDDGKLRTSGRLTSILGRNMLHDLGFDVLSGKVTVQQAVILNKAKEQPSESSIPKADDIELQEIMENAVRSTENLIVQLFPVHGLLGLDKQLRSIKRGGGK